MVEFLNKIKAVEHCCINNTYALTDEDAYNSLRDILEENHIKHETAENSYIGLYMIKIL